MAWLTNIKCTEKGKESLKKKGIPENESLHLHMVGCIFEKATVHPQNLHKPTINKDQSKLLTDNNLIGKGIGNRQMEIKDDEH